MSAIPSTRAAVGRFVENLFGEIAIDLFAGGGGMSMAWELATGRCVDEAVNHDADAIWMHQANHRNTRHWRDSVWAIDPHEVAGGRSVGWLHGSPDCTHFSIARGGKPVKKEIRGLAWCCLRWVAKLLPNLFTMENVREFLTWGPLVQKRAGRNRYQWEITRPSGKGKRGKAKSKIRFTVEGPHCDDGTARGFIQTIEALGYQIEPLMLPDKRRSGETFKQWLSQLQDLGYCVEWKVLDAADYGAPTHRRRLFIVARRDGQPIRWPAATHGTALGLKPYRSAAECIDFTINCPSIFSRKKDLAPNTLKRIVRGLVKFSIESSDPYIIRVDRGGEDFRGQSIHQPLPTLCADHGFAFTVPYVAGCGGRAGQSPETPIFGPLGTITGKNDRILLSPLVTRCAHGEDGRWGAGSHHVLEPLGTLTASKDYAVGAAFLYERHRERPGQLPRVRDLHRPLGVIDATGNIGNLVQPYLVELANSTWGTGFRSIRRPAPTLTATPKGGSWAMVAPLAVKYYRTGIVKPADEPLDAMTGRHRFGLACASLIKLRGSGGWSGVNEPVDTICAGAASFGVTTAFITHMRGTHGRGVGGNGMSPLSPVPTLTGSRHLYITQAAVPIGFESPAFDTTIYTPRELIGPCDNPQINRGFWRVYDLLRKHLGNDAPLPIVRKDGAELLIYDLGMRMFTPRELLNAQFGPELAKDYVLTGTRESQVAKIGNSVPPYLGAAVIAANWSGREMEAA